MLVKKIVKYLKEKKLAVSEASFFLHTHLFIAVSYSHEPAVFYQYGFKTSFHLFWTKAQEKGLTRLQFLGNHLWHKFSTPTIYFYALKLDTTFLCT